MGRFHNTHTNTMYKIWNITGLSELKNAYSYTLIFTFSLEADKTKICIEIPKITEKRYFWSPIQTNILHNGLNRFYYILLVHFVNGNAISQN